MTLAPMIYSPTDWYWIVGGNGPHIEPPDTAHTGVETRRFASRRNCYVPADDPEFVAWRDRHEFDPSTRIDTEENLADVLAPYGIVPNFGS